MDRPAGVLTIAIIFLGASAYLVLLAAIRLAEPGAVPLSLAAPLLHGLEIAGPYMFLLAATIAALIGWGLLRLRNFARRAAIVIAVLELVFLVPEVSAQTGDFSPRFFFAAVEVVIRVMIVWYLWQGWTAEKFTRS